jgi:hypothetical protein
VTAPILDRLAGLPKSREVRPGAWIGTCPAHEDTTPSLTWTTGEGGAALVKCHAGCSTEDVVDAVGMTMRDLFAPDADQASKLREVGAYDYHDAEGNLLYQVVRFEPKTFRQRRPDGRGGWIWNLDGVERVLYRLPDLRSADPNRFVLIVEGEKDVDRLHGSFVATTNVGGAGKWRSQYSDELRGRRVAILPDNDDAGRQHADDVARQLVGIAAEVRIVHLPDLAGKGDVTDWLNRDHTRDELKQIILATPPLTEAPPRDISDPAPATLRFYTPTELAAIVPPATDWLVRGLLAIGAITEIDGKIKAAGKTTLTLHMVRALLDGAPFLGEPTLAARVIYVTEQSRQTFTDALRLVGLDERGDELLMGQDLSSLVEQLSVLFADARNQVDADQMLNGTGAPQLDGLLEGLGTAQNTAGTALTHATANSLVGGLGPRYQPRAQVIADLPTILAARRLSGPGSETEWPIVNEAHTQFLGKGLHEMSTLGGRVVYGDFKHYLIADRIGASIEIVSHLFGSNRLPTGQRGAFFWRTGTQVLVANAFRTIRPAGDF